MMATTEYFAEDNSNATATLQCEQEKTKAKDVMQYGVATIDKKTSVYQAIALMVKKNVTGLPVVDESGLVGLISEKDVLKLLYHTEFVEGCVRDYMTTKIFTFDEEDALVDVCRCLMQNSFRRVPVMRQGRLAGIISRADLIRANKDKFRPRVQQDAPMSCPAIVVAKDVMKSGLLTVRTSTPVYEAMEILATKNVTGLPVVDEYMNMLGIISEKDMLKLLYDPNAKPGLVEEYMTAGVIGFEQNTPLFDICDCLIDNSFRRVPILNHGKLVGIISRTDIMAYIMKNHSRFFNQKPKD
ncbi:MAG: CBS domain-containing protein [Sedimentisphaerales bacterium]|jgi:CBS domain-containing protein